MTKPIKPKADTQQLFRVTYGPKWPHSRARMIFVWGETPQGARTRVIERISGLWNGPAVAQFFDVQPVSTEYVESINEALIFGHYWCVLARHGQGAIKLWVGRDFRYCGLESHPIGHLQAPTRGELAFALKWSQLTRMDLEKVHPDKWA